MAQSLFNDARLSVRFAPYFYLYALVIMMFTALPAYFIGRHFNLIRWWSVLLVGVLIGAAVSLVLTTVNFAEFFTFCGLGFLSSLTFWLIWRKGE